MNGTYGILVKNLLGCREDGGQSFQLLELVWVKLHSLGSVDFIVLHVEIVVSGIRFDNAAVGRPVLILPYNCVCPAGRYSGG